MLALLLHDDADILLSENQRPWLFAYSQGGTWRLDGDQLFGWIEKSDKFLLLSFDISLKRLGTLLVDHN